MGKTAKSPKKCLKFNRKLLKKLKNKEESGVEVHNAVQHLAIHPCELNNFQESVKDLLDEKVAKYNNKFNGIILGYQHMKLVQDGGVIHEDSCYIHFDIQADFFVFKPEIGKIMQGKVYGRSADHLAVLVYETFNVSIPIYDEDDDTNIGANVKVGDIVTFQILYINLASILPYIRGKLIVENPDIKMEENSNEEIPERNETDEPKIKKNKKKKIKIEVVEDNF